MNMAFLTSRMFVKKTNEKYKPNAQPQAAWGFTLVDIYSLQWLW